MRPRGFGSVSAGTACIACGHEFKHDYDATNNHWLTHHDEAPFPVCIGMSLTFAHVFSHLRSLAFPDESRPEKCWCCGDSRCVCGVARSGHKDTPEHQADKLANYWIPRVFTYWPEWRHAYLRTEINAVARYFGVLDLVRGDA